MKKQLISLWVWLNAAGVVLIWVPWMALVYAFTVPFDPGRYTVGRWFRRAAIAVTSVNPMWKFRTTGFRIRDPRRPYVAVANHESFADIFLISHLPWEMKWLSKESIFKIPMMGWMMRMAGDIAVRRGDVSSRRAALDACRDRLSKRVSVMIMPEGTRSSTGEIQSFHDGAFRLAIETGCPILPIAVAGTRAALNKGSWVMGRANAIARVLEPVETAGMTLDDVAELRDRVRLMIVEARAGLLRELQTA
ncbi:MAG TPA: lysophospholipid acyltransferase family protein [Longimicrobium sp.]|jgi:1-acyl-sn-glycerol-3-phosphate acyltransferase|uniref:lysophospholipid acyltransferase family protein n=1 Tax=Longimicrobium sp. TaxID=2029185 RepID=UPI002ED99FF4